MSTTDTLTITSAPDALTRYYHAKEREESAVLYINDAYLEAVDALEKLEAENAKLREEFNKMDVWHSKELTAAMDENAKLRELVRDMHAVISDRNSWWDCMYKDTRRFADRMRELSMEVDA